MSIPRIGSVAVGIVRSSAITVGVCDLDATAEWPACLLPPDGFPVASR
jgi:hypothetical protein